MAKNDARYWEDILDKTEINGIFGLYGMICIYGTIEESNAKKTGQRADT